jgi:hydrogenase maturation protease
MSAPQSSTGRSRSALLPARRPIQVLGLGNLIYSDDGAGVAALGRLRNHPRLPSGVELVDGGLFGLQVVSLVENASRLLLLDAVDVGASAGTVIRMKGEELERLPRGLGAHEFGAPDLLSLFKLRERGPDEVVFLGIQPASIALGTSLSAEVESGLNRLIAAAIRQLAAWTR